MLWFNWNICMYPEHLVYHFYLHFRLAKEKSSLLQIWQNHLWPFLIYPMLLISASPSNWNVIYRRTMQLCNYNGPTKIAVSNGRVEVIINFKRLFCRNWILTHHILAGRVRDGRVFRLVHLQFYEAHCPTEHEPEMRRAPLDKIILVSKSNWKEK